jgi:hypothetical protein
MTLWSTCCVLPCLCCCHVPGSWIALGEAQRATEHVLNVGDILPGVCLISIWLGTSKISSVTSDQPSHQEQQSVSPTMREASRIHCLCIEGLLSQQSQCRSNSGSCSCANGNALSGQQAPHVHVSPDFQHVNYLNMPCNDGLSLLQAMHVSSGGCCLSRCVWV